MQKQFYVLLQPLTTYVDCIELSAKMIAKLEHESIATFTITLNELQLHLRLQRSVKVVEIV